MTNDEAKAHFTTLAQQAGLSKEETASVLQAMDNEKFRTALSQGYKRHEEYSRGLDEVRAERERLKTWYEREELPKFQQYQAGLQRLQQYEDAYGPLEDPQGLNNGGYQQHGATGNGRGNGAGMTKEEMDRYLEERLRQRDAAYVGLTKSVNRISADHMQKFKETLDLDAVEKIALERGLPFDQAYKEFVGPKEQALTEARHKEEIEKAKAEAIRDYQSRHNLPVDAKPRESHPFWDRESPDPKRTALDQDRTSKEEFMKGWNNYETEMKPSS